MDNTENTLYQFLSQDIIDPEGKLDKHEWIEFVNKFQEDFDRETIDIGIKMVQFYVDEFQGGE